MAPCISAGDANLAIKLCVFIYGDSYILHSLSWLNLGISDGDLGCTSLFEIVLASKDDEVCLFIIKFQIILCHPQPYVLKTQL